MPKIAYKKVEQLKRERELLTKVSNKWNDVAKFVSANGKAGK